MVDISFATVVHCFRAGDALTQEVAMRECRQWNVCAPSNSSSQARCVSVQWKRQGPELSLSSHRLAPAPVCMSCSSTHLSDSAGCAVQAKLLQSRRWPCMHKRHHAGCMVTQALPQHLQARQARAAEAINLMLFMATNPTGHNGVSAFVLCIHSCSMQAPMCTSLQVPAQTCFPAETCCCCCHHNTLQHFLASITDYVFGLVLTHLTFPSCPS